MADNLSFSWELKGNLEKQILAATKDMENFAKVIAEVNADMTKMTVDKMMQNIKKNTEDAEKALYKLVDAKEKADKALSRNASLRSEGLLGVDESQLLRSSARLDEIIHKIMNIGAEASLSRNAVKNMLASLSADIALKDLKGSTSAMDKGLDKQVRDRARAEKAAIKEIESAFKDADKAAQNNVKNQEKVKDALARIATARANLSAASDGASMQDQMHARLLMSLLDKLAEKLNNLKGQFLGEKGILDGVLGSGYQGLMRNVSVSTKDILRNAMNRGGMGDEEWARHKAAAQAADEHNRKLQDLTIAFNRLSQAEERERQQQARSLANQQAVYNARQQSAQATRKQAEELVRLRMEMLKAQQAELQGVLKKGRGVLDAQQYEEVRNALRAVREEMRQLEGVMQRMGSYSSRELLGFGRGTGMNYSPLAKHANDAIQASVAVQQLTDSERRLADALKNSNDSMAGQSRLLSDMKTMLAQYVSLWGAKSFLNNIIETGGLLEQQRLSIGAILGNMEEANELFERIKALALKSPFGVVELDKMSKQLTAYGFQYHELYDWTKRLADISAATGTEVSRLSLALGHVRSEGALSGYTLRQFAMGNVPLLQKLAENLGITTKEVRERVRKKDISYEDVKEVLRQLTDEGGMFYNAQETMSEALNAKFKNLRDAFDITYGEIAESGIGSVLKTIAKDLTAATKNWKVFLAVIASSVGLWITAKIAMLAYNRGLKTNTAALLSNEAAMKSLNAQMVLRMARSGALTREDLVMAVATKKLTFEQSKLAAAHLQVSEAQLAQLASTTRLKTGMAGMWAGIKGFAGMLANPYMIAMASFEAYMAMWTSFTSWIDKIDDKTQSSIDSSRSRIYELDKKSREMSEGKPTDEGGLRNRIDSMKLVLANSEAYTKTLDEQLSKSGNLSEQYDILLGAINKSVEGERKMLLYQEEIGEAIKSSSTNARNLFDWAEAAASFGLGLGVGNLIDIGVSRLFGRESGTEKVWDFFFNDDIEKNVAQLRESYVEMAKVTKGAYEYRDAIEAYVEKLLESGEVAESFKNQLRDMPIEEQIRLLAESKYWNELVNKIAETDGQFEKTSEKLKEAAGGVTERWDEIANNDIPRIVKSMAEQEHAEEEDFKRWAASHPDEFAKELDELLKRLDEKEPQIRQRLKRMFFDYLSLSEMKDGIVGGATIGGVITGGIEQYLKDEELANLDGDNDNNKNKGTKGNKKDEALERARTILQEYKSFLSEYKKYREQYDKDTSISLLEELFPELKGKGASLVDNYADMLDKLRDSIELTTEARKKFANEVNKTKADTLFEMEKDALKRNADAMTEYTKRMDEQWKLYHTLLKKSGGNKYFASMAFGSGVVWDDVSKRLLEKFNQRGNELGVIPVAFNWDMSESEMKEALVDAKGQIQPELLNLAKTIKSVITDNYKKFLEDSAEAYNKSLTAAEKLAELERQRNELIEKRNNDNDKSETKQEGWNAQISAIDKQIASQRLEAFKEAEQWGRIFGNLDNITTDTLTHMRERMLEMAPSLRGSVEETKALYEAIEKIDDVVNGRNPFKAMGAALTASAGIRQMLRTGLSDYGFRNANGTFTISEGNAKRLGLTVNNKGEYTEQELNDANRRSRGNFNKGLNGLIEKFKAIQDAMTPVIDLFDALGMTSLSSLFSAGSNALGAAAQMGQGATALFGAAGGPWGAAIGAGLSIVSSVFAMHDQALQEEIEASQQRQKEMENLTKNLESVLERTLGGIYNFSISAAARELLESRRDSIEKKGISGVPFGGGTDFLKDVKEINDILSNNDYYMAQRYAMQAQKEELERQMRLEADKKDSDYTKISDYKQQIDDITAELENFALEMAKALWDIDIKSWASELTDAIVTAWQNGEDAVEAYRDKVKEMMLELTKNVIAQRVMEQILSNLGLDKLIADIMDAESGKLNYENIGAIAELLMKGADVSAEAITGILDAMEAKGYISKGDGTSSTSSKVIQGGFTENETGLLLSYVNGIRADVSVNRETLWQILAAVQQQGQMPVIAQAQLQQLQTLVSLAQTRNGMMQDIYNILHASQNGSRKLQVTV